MLEKIHIRNFQSHKNSTLELCEGVNVIIGDSDVGKSAIIRALLWLTFNRPTGVAFMRHNVTTPTSITVTADFGELTHARNEKQSWYELNGQTYKGFGTGVPPQVVQAMNMGEINFMRQLDPPFMFSKSGGELAQYLNRLINLDIIDSSLSNIKRNVTQTKNQVSACEENITRLISTLDDFSELPDMEKAVEEIEATENKIGKLKQRKKILTGELELYQRTVDNIGKYKWCGSAGKRLDDVLSVYSKLREKRQKMKQLEFALSELQNEEANIQSCTITKALEKAILRCSDLNENLCSQKAQAQAIRTVLQRLQTEESNYEKSTQIEQQLQAEYEQIKPKTCPVCGQKWR